MPTRVPSASTMGTPLMWKRSIKFTASWMVFSGDSLIGWVITPCSDRLTRSTSSACRSIDIFRWMTPTPPSRAMATASLDSVTVSIGAETIGARRTIPGKKGLEMSTSLGNTSVRRGTSKTSSKLRPSRNGLMQYLRVWRRTRRQCSDEASLGAGSPECRRAAGTRERARGPPPPRLAVLVAMCVRWHSKSVFDRYTRSGFARAAQAYIGPSEA